MNGSVALRRAGTQENLANRSRARFHIPSSDFPSLLVALNVVDGTCSIRSNTWYNRGRVTVFPDYTRPCGIVLPSMLPEEETNVGYLGHYFICVHSIFSVHIPFFLLD